MNIIEWKISALKHEISNTKKDLEKFERSYFKAKEYYEELSTKLDTLLKEMTND